MDEVSSLPKLTNDQHSSTCGHLANYHNSISEQLMRIIGHLQQDVKLISDKTTQKLTEKMNEYRKQYDQAINESREIIDSMTSTPKTFEELREQLKLIGDNLLNSLNILKQDCATTYTQSFTEIKPYVDQAYTKSKDIIIQVPPNISERLQSEVTRINANFLKSKQDLTKILCQVELNTRNSIQSYGNEFEQRKDKWKENRFNYLIEQAKIQLDPNKFVDFGDLYEKFYHEQANFTLCFRKTLTNVTFFLPPDRFSNEIYEEWVKEIDEDIECHNNFLKIFESKFTDKVSQQMDINSQLISQLETELVELKNESDASVALMEIYPLFKSTQKVNSTLIEKMHKYWEHRQNCIKTSFDSIKSFLQPLIVLYTKFCEDMNSIKEKEEKMTCDLKEKSNQKLEELEEKLKDTEDEINILVSEEEINLRVEKCRDILTQIESEYRQIHEDLNALFDTFPTDVKTVFETVETSLLETLKLTKTDITAVQPITAERPSSSSKSSKKHHRKKGTPVTKFRPIVLDGAKFEEAEPIVLIPTFDDFIDEPTAPTPQKSKQNRSVVKKPPKPKPPLKPGAKPGSLPRGRSPIDEYDDAEAPEFSLVDVVPKIGDVVSIWVYAPMPEEVSDWPRAVRTDLLKCVYGEFDSCMKWANDSGRRESLTEQLNERVRVNMPRMSLIELNVAEARKAQIESRQVQLESFFRRQALRFNGKVQVLQTNLDKLCEKITCKVEEMRSFSGELKEVKSTSAFSVLKQNRTIAETSLSTNFDKFVNRQTKEIEDFFAFFETANNRFKENVLLADSSYSDDEREVASQYFQRMDEQVSVIRSDLISKATANVEKVKTLRDQISSEFNNSLPHNMSDVALIEMAAALQKEYSSKYETLLFNNFTMERDLNQSIETAKSLSIKLVSESPITDHQSLLDDIFASLEDLRQKLIDRGVFLKQLSSKIPSDPLKYVLLLESGADKDGDSQGGDEPDENEILASSSEGKKNVRPTSKANDRKLKGKQNNAKQQKKNQKAKTRQISVVLPVEKSLANPLTFEGRIEQLRQDLLNTLVEKAADYYASLKGRNFPITRPELIPPTQQDLVNKMSDKWNELTEKVPSISGQSILNYKYKVIESSDVIREAQNGIFEVFTDFYVAKAQRVSERIKKNFDFEFDELFEKKNNNMKKLTPKFADINNFDEFNRLFIEEDERNKKEKMRIQYFTRHVIETEKQAMNHFLTNLPLLVKNLLTMLDRFPFIEDLKSGRIEKVERKTMRQLLIDKNRSTKNQTKVANRPFSMRDWPVLSMMMKSLSDFIDSSSVSAAPTLQETAANVSTASLMSAAKDEQKNKKKKKAGGVGGNAKLEKNANSNKASLEGQKSKDSLGAVAVNSSLDTAVHRTVIMSRKRSYEGYEEKLAERLEVMKKAAESMSRENDEFEKSWNAKVKELYPEFKPQKIEREERPSSKLEDDNNK